MRILRAIFHASLLCVLAGGGAYAAELPGKGRYLVTFNVSQTTQFVTGPKTERKTRQRLIAFQGNKVLVSADTEAAAGNSFLGTEHTGPGRKCKKDGTAGEFCSTVSMVGNKLTVRTVYNFSEGTFLHDDRYTVAFTANGCTVENAAYSMTSKAIFEGSSGRLLGASCTRQ